MARKMKRAATRGGTRKAAAKSRKRTAGRAGPGKKAAKATKAVTKPAAGPQRPAARKAAAKAGRPRKTHLRRKDLQEFREMLLEKRRTLVGDLTGMEQETFGQSGGGNLSSMPTHMADVGTDNFEHEFTLGLLESEQAMLSEINQALQRIEDRTYGVCLGTGKTIPKARLRAKPWAKYTVEYTRMLEKGLVQEPGPDEVAEEEGQDEEE